MNSLLGISRKLYFQYDFSYNNSLLYTFCHVVYATMGIIFGCHPAQWINIVSIAPTPIRAIPDSSFSMAPPCILMFFTIINWIHSSSFRADVGSIFYALLKGTIYCAYTALEIQFYFNFCSFMFVLWYGR